MAKPRGLSPALAALGVRLRVARELAGLTQSELARVCDVDRSAIVRWERGQGGEPGVMRLADGADHLGVSLDWLVSGKGAGPSAGRAAIASLIRDTEKRLAPKAEKP